MSIFPSLRAEFDKALSAHERDAALEKLRAIKGVFSVGYNTHSGVINVSFGGGKASVVKQVRAIPGLVNIDARHRF